jgi:predicted DNA-binding protein
MAKKKAGGRKVQTATPGVKHARIELPDADYERLKRVAKSIGLGVAAFIRQAVLRDVRRVEDEMEGGK